MEQLRVRVNLVSLLCVALVCSLGGMLIVALIEGTYVPD